MSEHQPKIREYDKIKYSDKDLWWAVSKTAVASFIVVGIFFRFLTVENVQLSHIEALELLKEELLSTEKRIMIRLNEKDAEQTRRLDTKTSRNKSYIDENSKAIEKLEEPYSDIKMKSPDE